ncbi:uncharacterized protein [Typha latifolia]|uniref:uncharacterized protein n=1 Tax=Typha latifolia TaxID=4733 RepID=UPI003C2ACE7E
MESSYRELPPSKRFKLRHIQNSPQPLDSHIPKCLPAKKRSDLLHLHHQSPTSLCLPAKKRVWAPLPISPIKTQEQHEEKNEEESKKVILEVDQEEEEDDDDDGVTCAVCRSTDGDPSDPIVFCDGCDLMVHASCYGNPLAKSIPEGDWFCLLCERRRNKKRTKGNANCCLCPLEGGAVKPTVDGKWAHVMCSLLVPEVFFRDPEGRDGIDCSHIPTKRWEKDCYICESKKGCVIECSEPKCELGFHVSCGVEQGLCVEYKEGKGGAIVAGFCGDHTKLWEKQQLTGKFKIVSREKGLKGKTKV